MIGQYPQKADVSPLHRYPAYFVCCDGRVWSAKRRTIRPLTGVLAKGGYLRVTLRHEGRQHSRYVARLVCEAHHGPPPSARHEAAHCDGNPQNNLPCNLRWATPLENAADKARHGTQPRGASSPTAVLTPSDVRAIRSAHAAGGVTFVEIAENYGVNPCQIGNVVHRKSWAWL